MTLSNCTHTKAKCRPETISIWSLDDTTVHTVSLNRRL